MAIGSRLMLSALRDSGGTAVAVPDNHIMQAQKRLAVYEGMFISLEAAVTIAALEKLAQNNWVQPDEKVLVFNAGSGLKYRLLLV